MKKGLFKRLLVVILSTMLVISSMPINSLAAPAKTSAKSTETYSKNDNEKIANDAYQKYIFALRTGKESDLVSAYKLILNLTPTQRVHFFIHKYKDIYKSMLKNGDYSIFNPQKYLSSNPDVLSYARQKNIDPIAYALEHYLEKGIFEGRSSCTEFDPFIAIVAYPDATLEAIVSESKPSANIVSTLKKAFTQASGDTSTQDYVMVSLKPMSEDGVLSDIPDTYDLKIAKKRPSVSDTDNYLPVSSDSESHSWEPSSGSSDSGNTPAPGPNPGPSPSPAPSSNKQVVMIYLCGADLEKESSPSASKSIMNMLASAYDPNALEIYVLAGGSAKWYNDVIQNDIGGSNIGQVALYKLDPTKAGTITNESKPKDILNTENMIKQSTFELNGSNVSMGDPSVLTKFVDYVTANSDRIDYSLILWNHGGGINSTICSDYNNKDSEGYADGLDAEELVSALSETQYVKDNNKFSVLGFDACLMGGYELAYALKSCYKNMIGTPQIESGDFDYTQLMNNFSIYGEGGYSSKLEFLAGVMTTVATNGHDERQGGYMPFTCFDSQAMNRTDSSGKTINECIEDVSGKLVTLMSYDKGGQPTDEGNAQAVEIYKALKTAKAQTTIYGNGEKYGSYEYYDMGELFYNIKKEIAKLGESNPTKQAYSDLLSSLNAVIAHLESDNFVYLSAAYRDNGNLYINPVVNQVSYKDASETRQSNFSKALGISDKLLGVSIYSSERYNADNTTVTRFKNLGMENLGKLSKAYTDMKGTNIYSYNDISGRSYLFSDAGRISMLQGYRYDSEAANPDGGTGYFVKPDDAAKAVFADMVDVQNAAVINVNNGTKDIRYLYIPLKSDEAYAQTTSGQIEYSSQSAVQDYYDTVGRLTVFVSQYVDSTANGGTGNYTGDVLYLTKDIVLNNYSLGNNSITFGLEPENTEASDTCGYQVIGEGYQNGKSLLDVATVFGTLTASEENTVLGNNEGVFKYAKGFIARLFYDDPDDTSKATSADTIQYAANIYFKEKNVEGSSDKEYILVGATITSDEGDTTTYSKSEINTLSFYHYRVNEETNKIETIESLKNDNNENYDLGYNFFVNSYNSETREITGTYDVTLRPNAVAYKAEEIQYDKFAVGMMDNVTLEEYTNNNEYSGYYTPEAYSIVGNNLVYDASKYTENNNHFGYYTAPEDNNSPSENIEDEMNIDTKENISVSEGENAEESDIIEETEAIEEQPAEVIDIQDYLEPEKIEVIMEDAYLGDDENPEFTPDDTEPEDIAA